MKDAANGVSLASEVTSGRVAVGRREFLRQSVLTAGGTIVAGEFRAQSVSADRKSKVVIPHLPGAVGITNLKVYDTASPDGIRGGCPHLHLACTEAYVVLKGKGSVQTLSCEGFKEVMLEPGRLVWFTPGVLHRLVNRDGLLEILIIMQNAGLPEAGDFVLSFSPDIMADPTLYNQAATLAPSTGGDSTASDQSAFRRRDLAVIGFNQLREKSATEGPSAMEEFYRTAAALIEPKISHWRQVWKENALHVVSQTETALSALASGQLSNLLQGRIYVLPGVAGNRRPRFCGYAYRYELEGAIQEPD